jgi:hypothetical protein
LALFPTARRLEPDVVINYNDGDKEIFHTLTMDRIFSTREEAEQAGVELAQKWIDDGKPDLRP